MSPSSNTPAEAAEHISRDEESPIPSGGYKMIPLVALGGSAGAIDALRAFFEGIPEDSGLAFVVVLHLARDHESMLAAILQRSTRIPVRQVLERTQIARNTIYVIPPAKVLRTADGFIELDDMPTDAPHRHVAVDLFFRTLAETHGPHAIAVVLSGLDSDGAIGIKRIKERGGLTIAQDPSEAEHSGMPRAAIATGMIDWVLPARDMSPRIVEYMQMERQVRLPAEVVQGSQEADRESDHTDEASLRDVLTFIRTRTGRDFSCYKRATILRRIRRRMQVNGVETLADYLSYLRTRPGEAGALLQDLLITVTNFFRDVDCFVALEQFVPRLFHNKSPSDSVRVWVPACATGEEAYSIAILLNEYARTLEAPPQVQIFATDLDEEALRTAREGLYASTIEADVSEERLRRYFIKEHGVYRIRREIRETVLFAVHDVLKDSPFSHLELVSCRNLLIYLNREPQRRIIDTFHFALQPGGLLLLGSSESIEDGSPYFSALDKKHRIFVQRSTPRIGLPVPTGPGTLALALEAQHVARSGPVIAGTSFGAAMTVPKPGPAFEGHAASWGELHFKLLEFLSPPSLLVDGEHEILHLSPHAGRFLQYSGGEPSRNLLRAVHPSLRIELRAALYQAAQSGNPVAVEPLPVEIAGERLDVKIVVKPAHDIGPGLYIVILDVQTGSDASPGRRAPVSRDGDPVAHHLDRELERLKSHLRDTVEQYEASTEELKASNEELQAMNEELRSATEELETSREELQSINEELTTVNQELKNKVDELGHSNSDMHNLMDATAIATVFLDRELRITRFTPSAVKLFNLIPTDVGRPLSDLTTQLDYQLLTQDAREVLVRLIPIEREVSEVSGNWYLLRVRPYRTLDDRIAGVVLTFVDVTERKLAEAALRESKERMRLIIENAVEYAIFSMDKEGNISTWNAGAERLLGYSEAEIVGRNYEVLFTDEHRQAGVPQREIRRATSEGRADDDHLHLRKDGTEFWSSGVVMPLYDEAGEFVGFVKILRDQTEQRQSRDRLEASRGELLRALHEKEQATRALEAANVAKDHFLAQLSHELRNPLASVRSAAVVLAHDAGSAGDKERASRLIERQTGAIKVLLDDLVDIARMRLGRLTLHRRVFAFDAALERAVEMTEAGVAAGQLTLAVEKPQKSLLINGDEVRLAQVLGNLLSNAVKYTPAGGRIDVRIDADDEQIVCSVTDTGRGLEAEHLPSVFELFWQSPEDRSGLENDGFGLGLTLAKTIVELHDGHMVARSPGRGKGSTFEMVLPRSLEVAGVPDSTVAAAAKKSASRNSVRKILLVDDDQDAAWTLGKALELYGLDVKTAFDGESALKTAARFKPHAVVLDLSMPGMSGTEVARQLRVQSWAAHTRLIALTGWSTTDHEQATDDPFDLRLMKPIGPAELVELLRG